MRLKHINAHRAKDIKRTVLVISHLTIELLKKQSEIKLNDLYYLLKLELPLHQKDYILALNFLFAMGAIQYEKRKDVIRYLK